MPAATDASWRARLATAAGRLAEAGIDTARVDAEWLLAGTLGVRRGDVWLALDVEPEPAAAARFEAAVARRARREPLQQILGWEEFRGLRLRVTPDVLVPRPETEVLVERALDLLPPPGAAPLVADVGTGSGCIACAIARERADTWVVALDASLPALAVAAENVRALGLERRVRLVAADLLAALGPARFDLVAANPPYLPTELVAALAPEVREHEPFLALDGGPDGLAAIRAVVDGAARVLVPGGALVLETAGGAQAHAVAGLLAGRGFTGIDVRRDLTGTERIVSARRGPEPSRRT
jgi:release factor glutamine methyltransferase